MLGGLITVSTTTVAGSQSLFYILELLSTLQEGKEGKASVGQSAPPPGHGILMAEYTWIVL